MEKKSLKKEEKFGIIEFGKSLLFSIIFVAIFTTFIAKPIRVNGSSMYPTLIDKELGFSNVITLKAFGIHRFEVVIVYVDELKEYLVKRVIALPGETIAYKNETLYINGSPIEEPFFNKAYVDKISKSINADFTAAFGPTTVKAGEVWLMGDNRPFSSDSRRFGAFPIHKIVSKDAYILFPLNEIRIITK